MDNFLIWFSAALLVMVILSVLLKAVRKNNQRQKNELCPVITKKARVKRRNIINRPGNITALSVATDTLEGRIVFEAEDGEELEFELIGKPYREILDGEEGMLTYQGSEFISFERKE